MPTIYTILPLLLLFSYSAKGKEIKVCSTCSVNSIKQAVEIAQTGDVINVEKGIYNEHTIVIEKSIHINGKNLPVIDGKNAGGIFLVKANGVQIKGLQIQNTGTSYMDDRAAIKLIQVKNCIIENNKTLNTSFGIYLSKSDSCIIRNNELKAFAKTESAAGNGIHLWYCKNTLIEGNNVSGHRDGIYFEFVQHSLIKNNFSSNQIRYGMHFMFSHDNEYFHNTFQHNGAGVAVMYSKRILMHKNNFIDNWNDVAHGILLKDISDSRIEENTFERNTIGIYAEGCTRISITKNNFLKNGWALKILGNCEDNTIIQNNFIANTFEVVTNSSANQNYFFNNYWSDYNGYDLNKDGIGDVPHSPVKLFTYLIEQTPPSIVLLRSLFIDLLNLAEKITPVITPETLKDEKPLMKQF